MKVAICLSGLFRGMQVCLPTWQENLLNSDNQFDFFVCTGPTVEWCSGSQIDFHLKLLKSQCNVVDVMIEQAIAGPYDQILETRNFNKRNLEHFLSMFHKIQQANSLKSAYENEHHFKYDLVMRFRPDIYLKTPIKLEASKKWNVPKYGDFGGLNDQMAWGNSENMDFYSSLFDNIVPYLQADPALLLNPEYLTRYHWKKSGCALLRPNILYQLARDNTNMLPDNETRERLMRESNGTRNL